MGLRQSIFVSTLLLGLFATACSSSDGSGATDEDTGTGDQDTSEPTDDGVDSTVGDDGTDGSKDAGKDATGDTPKDADAADVVADTGSPFCSTPGAIESEPCGKCGTHSRLCAGDGGTWLPWGACTGETGDCTPLETRETVCGKCGKRTETCSPKCAWDKGTCTAEGVCNPGDVETAYACTTPRQTKTRTCDTTCTWSTFTDCAPVKGWDDMALPPVSFTGRQQHTAVWTGSDMVVWGGQASGSSYAADGAKYNLATDTWTILPTPAIVGRYAHVAVAAGTNKMIVWGGYNGTYRNDGAVLDLSGTTPVWTTMAAPPATFYGRYYASAVWTGTEMLVYGGYGSSCTGSYCADAALYDPVANSWRMAPAATIAGRYQAAMVWTGTKAVVFGGYGSGCTGTYCADGAVFDPSSTGTWTTLKATAPFDGRYQLLGLANGTQATFWGGYGSYVSPSYYKNTGGNYDDSATTTAWKAFTPPTDTVLLYSKRYSAVGWWAGGKMYVWGGYGDGGANGNGAIYDPATDTWTSMPVGGPSARYQATSVWTGTEAIIWGGYSYKNDGKVYRP